MWPAWVTAVRQILSTMFCDGNRGSIPQRYLAGPARLLIWDSAGPVARKQNHMHKMHNSAHADRIAAAGRLAVNLASQPKNATPENQSSPLPRSLSLPTRRV